MHHLSFQPRPLGRLALFGAIACCAGWHRQGLRPWRWPSSPARSDSSFWTWSTCGVPRSGVSRKGMFVVGVRVFAVLCLLWCAPFFPRHTSCCRPSSLFIPFCVYYTNECVVCQVKSRPGGKVCDYISGGKIRPRTFGLLVPACSSSGTKSGEDAQATKSADRAFFAGRAWAPKRD